MRPRRRQAAALGLAAVLATLPARAQAPLLQDGATALRQASLEWTRGEPPLAPSTLPFLEVGFGGSKADGPYTPLVGGEGLAHGSGGWGLGFQGRYVRGAWSVSATALALRHEGRTVGVLQRAALAYQTESGWRAALEQTPLAWGSGLLGGELLGDSARALSRLSLATPGLALPAGRWRLEAFAGQLEASRPIPEWVPDRAARLAARAAGLDLRRPTIWGGFLQAGFGDAVEARFGSLTLQGGRDAVGREAPAQAARSVSLAEMRIRVPALAGLVKAQGASLHLSRSAAPDDASLAWRPARNLGGLQLVWEGWDLGLEYAGAAPRSGPAAFTGPAHLAGFSTHGDPLGPAFGREVLTRTVDVGMPLFWEGRGRFKVVRATAPREDPSGPGSWFFQADAQWRTPTGRVGASLASRHNQGVLGAQGAPGAARWGWALSLFQAFRVF